MERLTDHGMDDYNEPGCDLCSAYCYGMCKQDDAVKDCAERLRNIRLAAYEDIGTVEEFAELKQAKSDGRIIPKEAHQPSFVKYDAVDIFDQWNDTTGALDKGTSWYYEIQSIIEEVAAMAFGAGAIYQSEASAALSEMGEQE